MTGQLPSHGDRPDPLDRIRVPSAEAPSVDRKGRTVRRRAKPTESTGLETSLTTVQSTPPKPAWSTLTVAKLKAADKDVLVAGHVRELVEAALAGDEKAIRLIGELFRTIFYARIRSISTSVGGFWPRHEMASDFLTFLVTGLRPSLKQRPAAPPSHSVIPDSTSSPLRKWLDKSPLPLRVFVNRTINRLGVDLIRRARVQARICPTDREELELRSDADAPEIPAGRWCGPKEEFGPHKRLGEEQREAMLLLAWAELTDQESHVLNAVCQNVPQNVIAIALGVSEPRISALKTRAIAKLRRALAQLELPSEGEGK